MSDEQTRLSINLNDDAVAFLDEITADRDISVTEAVRRALALYKLLNDATKNGEGGVIDTSGIDA